MRDSVDFDKLNAILEFGTKAELTEFLEQHKLKIKGGKIVAKFDLTEIIAHWNKLQKTRKILLNSLYGGLLNPGSKFNDRRLGQSTTLTGRCITHHMGAEINQLIAGTYDPLGETIIYGDSVTGDSLIRTKGGSITIEELFNSLAYKVVKQDGKEYAMLDPFADDISVLGYNAFEDIAEFNKIAYVMRHKTTKKKWRITSESSRQVTVTDDHSIIVDRDGFTEEIKPQDLKIGDIVITINFDEFFEQAIEINTIRDILSEIECLGNFEDEYVYDLSIKDQDPFFFANDLLVHNTDSRYFSAHPILKEQIKNNEVNWDTDSIIEFYDEICRQANLSFPAYMKKGHNCPDNYGSIIAAGRETVSKTGLFIIKKRYGLLIVDDENSRKDINGKPGKVKAAGMDLKRSDTPDFMQEFLKEILEMVLTNGKEEDVINRILEFRQEFRDMPPWLKGTPKRVNNLTNLTAIWEKTGKCRVGHALAAINYNRLIKLNNDKYSLPISDGMKTIVCKLKPNPLGIKSVGIPTDEKHIPDWYKDLPFDEKEMEHIIITKKIKNLLGVLNWDLSRAEQLTTFADLFTFN